MSKNNKNYAQDSLFETKLDSFINLDHKLVLVADKINWEPLINAVEEKLSEIRGRPALSGRLIIGLHLLKYLENISDETVVEQYVQNPYYQYFCGQKYFLHELPCDPTSLVKWRKRLGASFFEKLLKESIDLAMREKIISPKELNEVYVDTTVQEKNIQFPTDARLYFKGIQLLNKAAKNHGIKPKQSYKFNSKRLVLQYGRYAHAKQMKRARRCLRKLKTSFGRLIRDIDRKITKEGKTSKSFTRLLNTCQQIFNQTRSSKNKTYSYVSPEVKCISKGKAHKRYEFGNKVSISTTTKSSLIVGVESYKENIFDGKTLQSSIDQLTRMTSFPPKLAYVDRGYRGYTGQVSDTMVYHQGQRRGISKRVKLWLKRRSRIEPVIGHLKSDHRLGRNYLLGDEGNEINIILAATAFNLKKALRAFYAFFQIQLFFTKAV